MNKEEFYRRVQADPYGFEAQLYNAYLDRQLEKLLGMRNGELSKISMGTPTDAPPARQRVFDPKTGLPIE